MFSIGDRVAAYCPIRQQYLTGTVTYQSEGRVTEVVRIVFDGDTEDYLYTANNVVRYVGAK